MVLPTVKSHTTAISLLLSLTFHLACALQNRILAANLCRLTLVANLFTRTRYHPFDSLICLPTKALNTMASCPPLSHKRPHSPAFFPASKP